MKLNFDIELDTTEEPEIITVEIEGYPKMTDDAYDDEFGTVRNILHPTMEDSIINWYTGQFTEEQNEKILAWIQNNISKVEEKFCKQFLKDKNDYL